VECLQCHTAAGGFAIGFNTPQMNRDLNYAGTVTNQIAALSLAGYFNTNIIGIHTLRSLAHSMNEAVSQEYRVRSYLAANCAQCHQPGGTAQGSLWDARITTRTALAGIINGALQNNGGDTNNRVVVPGSLSNSMMLTRLSTLGPGRMPPLDSNLVDTNAVNLISSWITNDLPSYQTFAEWQIANFGSTNAPNSGASEDADSDGASNYLEYLTHTDAMQATNLWTIGVQLNGNLAEILFPQVANRGFEVQSTSALFPASWSPLNVPQNAPFFSATNRNWLVPDTVSETNKFYRVRVFEP
jgi:mono/diheme cytochrome c family protein